MEVMQVTSLRTLASFPSLNGLVAVSKGMWAVKVCSNKILQFLTDSAGKHRLTSYNGHKMVVHVLVSYN